MEPFSTQSGVAAFLPIDNVNTDLIIPKQFLKTIKRTGLGKGLFYDLRLDVEGNEIPDFVLNREPYRTQTKVLVSGENFGSGSSREHAPWALWDFGIRCVVASSFADIFFNNAGKNGLLLAAVPPKDLKALSAEEERMAGPLEMTVDLPEQTITVHGGGTYGFAIDAETKRRLLLGQDDIAITMEHLADIEAFERKRRERLPWLSRGVGEALESFGRKIS